ncbi:hypothetical protein WMF27_31375 [Sorangium sp. So ce281]|uniref:hypothetical protein n=1 Tax=unclassified Sorangium TaxID=2621164 RepID=UPI003F616257
MFRLDDIMQVSTAAACAATASAAFLGGPAVAALPGLGCLDLAIAHGQLGMKRDDADRRIAVLATSAASIGSPPPPSPPAPVSPEVQVALSVR